MIVDSAGIEDDPDDMDYLDDIIFEEKTESIGKREFEDYENEEDEDEEDKTSSVKKKSKKVVNYGKISSAIGKMKQVGVRIVSPDINHSKFTFVPDVENNQIIYGIKGITRINDDFANTIIANRPYTSFEDFLQKVKANKLQIINLIKSGAFDGFGEDRPQLMKRYIEAISNCKQRLTLQNMSSLINYNIIPEEYSHVVKVYMFNKFIKKNKLSNGDYCLDEYSQNFYSQYFDVDYLYCNTENSLMAISAKVWDKIYKAEMEKIRPFLNNPATLDLLNQALIQEQTDKYALGTGSKWEMDSIGFYQSAHELDGLDLSYYDVDNFFDLPDEPIIDRVFTTKDGKVIPLYVLNTIVGTVLERDKLKNTVTLLTQDGVIKIKIFKPQFVKYDRQISVVDEETGKKKIVGKSWFSRGNKLIVHGIKRNDNFIPKKYKSSSFPNVIALIEDIDYYTGKISATYTREEAEGC